MGGCETDVLCTRVVVLVLIVLKMHYDSFQARRCALPSAFVGRKRMHARLDQNCTTMMVSIVGSISLPPT